MVDAESEGLKVWQKLEVFTSNFILPNFQLCND